MTSRRRDRPVPRRRDALTIEIHDVLTADLIQPRYRAGAGQFDGYCYCASEAYFHLAGGREAGLQPMQLEWRDTSHWWLVNRNGRVIDLTLGPGEGSGRFPYERGNRKAFRWTKDGPSKRARTIIERVRQARKA